MSSPWSRRSFLRAVGLVALGTATACGSATRTPAARPAASAVNPAAVPAGWVALAAEHLVHAGKLSPPAASRLFAYTTIALHEAVAAAVPGAESLGGRLTGMPMMPAVEPGLRVEPAAAAAAAARNVLVGMLGTATADIRSAIDTLYADQRGQQAAAGSPDDVLQGSAAHGQRIAAAVLGWAERDGLSARDAPFELRTGPGLWEITPPETAPVEPHRGTLRPFALDAAHEVRAPSPPYSAEPGSEFHAQATRVYDTSRSLTDEQRGIARFWAAAPAVRWMTIAADQVQEHGLTLDRATQALALTAIALADATIASWAGKYEYTVLRPVTYIQRHLDPAWKPLLPTPAHPEFPAGHTAGSTAATTVLTAVFGNVPVTARAAAGTEPERRHLSFDAAAAEVAMSRVYAGVHYPMGLDAGTYKGRRVGQLVLERWASVSAEAENRIPGPPALPGGHDPHRRPLHPRREVRVARAVLGIALPAL